jgi:outer membrane protein assembly factor BamE (lipoprotein component of BamABCDE complex)
MNLSFLRKGSFAFWAVLTFLVSGMAGCDSSNPSAAVSGSKITRANFNQIHDGASKDQVRAILGEPTTAEVSDKIIYKRTTWRYTDKDKYINITFKNDELDSKDTNLGTD